MRSGSRFSLTLLGKGRGQDGDLLLLQLSDFILQLDNSLPNCPDLGRVTERAEGDMGVLQTALPLGSSSPLVNPDGDPSLLPSGRTHRPGSPAVPCPGVPPGRPAPCPRRPSCHPPARAGFTGITSLLWLCPHRTLGLPGLPSPQATPPCSEDQEPCLPARPQPVLPSHPCSPDFSPASAHGSCPAWRSELPLPSASAPRAARF